jgi:hypothetical protein
LTGLVAGSVGAAVGVDMSTAVPVGHRLVAALLTACCAAVAFVMVAHLLLDQGVDLRAFLAQLRRATRLRA